MCSLSGKRIAIMVAQQYEDQEAWFPYLHFKSFGASVTVVGEKAGEICPSKHGYPMKVDRSAADVKAADFDCVIVPGGFAPDFMRRSDSMLRFFKDAADAGCIIAAICHGPWMLCTVPGLLKGKKATSFSAIRFDLQNAGAKWVDQECCVDGNIITARKPDDLPAFCNAIVECLSTVKTGA